MECGTPPGRNTHLHRNLFMAAAGMNPRTRVSSLSRRRNIDMAVILRNHPEQERMQQIAAFSELEEFFDRPVRLYCSGMRSRLSFSLFVFLDCDVLMLDEVLAVGDIFFKQMCYAPIEELIAKGTTILLVTHSTVAVRQFCDHVIVLDKGRKFYYGEPIEGIQMYSQIKGDRLDIQLVSTS